MPAFKNLIGQTFNRLTVISQVTNSKRVRWTCRCACGNLTDVDASTLKSGSTKSCGCLKAETNNKKWTSHGLSSSVEYKILSDMLERCYNPNNKSYSYYGARGIDVCERWNHVSKIESFIADMGVRPTAKHTIDREDNSLGYSPKNCRWVTREVQMNNTRANVPLTLNGITKNIGEWDTVREFPTGTISSRLAKGWAAEDAITKPINTANNHSSKWLTLNGRRMNITQWAKELNMSATGISDRLRAGWSVERTLTKPVAEAKLITFEGESHSLKEWAGIKNIQYQTLWRRLHKHHWSLERAFGEATQKATLIEFDGQALSIKDWADNLGVTESLLKNRKQQGWSVERMLTEPAEQAAQLTHDGKTLSIFQWSKVLGLPESCIRSRHQAGWSDEKALTTPLNKVKTLSFDGAELTISQWSKRIGMGVPTIKQRLKNGWSDEEVLTTPIGKKRK